MRKTVEFFSWFGRCEMGEMKRWKMKEGRRKGGDEKNETLLKRKKGRTGLRDGDGEEGEEGVRLYGDDVDE